MPTGVIGPESPVSMTTSMALAVTPWTPCLAVLRIPRHVVFEPLRVRGDRLDLRRLLAVDVEDERFPRALDAARVEVDLDEAVDRVDRRRLVLHPGDVVRLAVGVFAGPVERDQRAQRPRHRLGRERNRRFEVLRRSRRSARRSGRRPVDLFDEPAVALHEPRVQRVLLVEALEIRHRHADVEVVGAGGEDVLAGAAASCW